MIRKIVSPVLWLLFLFACTSDKPEQWIRDEGGFYSKNEEKKLKQLQRLIEENTTSEVAIITTDSISGENVNAYSLNLAHRLELGKEGLNNGILIFACRAPFKVRIQVGLGVEWQLSDAYSRVLIKSLIRNFRKEDYFQGTLKVLKMIREQLNKVSWKVQNVDVGRIGRLSMDKQYKVIKFSFERKVAVDTMPKAVPDNQQFPPEYFVEIPGGLYEGAPVKLYYSKYMRELLKRLENPEYKEVYARVRSVNPVELELIGVEE